MKPMINKLILFIYATIVYVIPLLVFLFIAVVMPMIGAYYIIAEVLK